MCIFLQLHRWGSILVCLLMPYFSICGMRLKFNTDKNYTVFICTLTPTVTLIFYVLKFHWNRGGWIDPQSINTTNTKSWFDYWYDQTDRSRCHPSHEHFSVWCNICTSADVVCIWGVIIHMMNFSLFTIKTVLCLNRHVIK